MYDLFNSQIDRRRSRLMCLIETSLNLSKGNHVVMYLTVLMLPPPNTNPNVLILWRKKS